MATPTIIRIPTEEEGAFILVQVTATSSKPLDVKLVATEGQAPYASKLRHNHIAKSRTNSSSLSADDWEGILKSVLLDGEPIDGVEAVAKVYEGQSIEVVIRRRIEGINQKLGALTLDHKEDEAIELLDWCSDAVLSRQKAREAVTAAVARADELEAAVTDLRGQLEELIQAKKSDEVELLEKFRNLLNEKKVKIREQARLLDDDSIQRPKPAANPSSPAVKQEEQTSPARPPPRRAAMPPRRPKRKAAQAAVSEDDSDDGFEKMDVDTTNTNDAPRAADESEDQQTTDGEATSSGSDREEEPETASSPGLRSGPAQAVKKDARATTRQAAKPKPTEPPPPRVLPFGLGKKAAATKPDEEDSGSGDDEL